MQSLDCHGILRATPIHIANPTLYLDFHIFDLPENLSHNIIIGRPFMKIMEKVPRDQELELKVGKEYIEDHVWFMDRWMVTSLCDK
jgi:hypothetical protein